ncbi:META domain-containing protein [Halopseudomonas oceani]|uniref:META domain-containing protein n=1 Tax=Halopseudomonas oceani TaxID=1708783 RepID=UPI002AA8131F|nr:META domain-containing protein [Halopseudomonas oceani]
MNVRQAVLAAGMISAAMLAGCSGLDSQPAEVAAPEQQIPQRGVMILQCGRTPVRVTLTGDQALVEAMQGRFLLERVVTASGARYEAPDDSSTSFWNKGDQGLLTIRGESLPECEPAGALVLQAGEWVVEDINRGGIIDRSRVTLNFGNDGRVSGRASCNNYVGAYQVDGRSLQLTQLATTRRACAPALNEQETRFVQTLEQISRFHLDETGALILEGDEGGSLKARLE